MILVVALCAAGGLLWLWRRGSRARRARFFKAEGMPAELAEGRLLMSEVDITCDHPIALAGRPDQVYLLANGRDIVPVDSKVRERVVVYDKDRVQLGAYRVLLENSQHRKLRGKRVTPYGYLRVVRDQAVHYVKVMLPTEQDAIAVYDRYLRIVEGRTPARRHGRGSPFCRRCAYRAVCR